MNTSPVIDRHLTRIYARGQSAQLSRTVNKTTNTAFFQFWDHRPDFNPMLTLVDSALDEAQRQVDQIKLPGCFAHNTAGGRQLLFKLKPRRKISGATAQVPASPVAEPQASPLVACPKCRERLGLPSEAEIERMSQAERIRLAFTGNPKPRRPR